MGNMAYPVVTRLGLNQFWYRHWYGDTNYNFTRNYKQTRIFKYLFKMYLNYGLTFSNTVFLHEIFFSKPFKLVRRNLLIKNLKHFRRFFFTHDRLGIEHSYLLRYRTGEYFPLRIWVFSWSKWFIISFNCFKPIKKKSTRIVRQPKDQFAISASMPSVQPIIQLRRFKLLFIYLKKYFSNTSTSYLF